MSADDPKRSELVTSFITGGTKMVNMDAEGASIVSCIARTVI